ncbi:MAG: ATP-binding cassette domain-containing protein [Gammaproteobacteria bacterium]|nr:ATP-binding cassette domain-containing protein [Gammaproteobacteria bacterium]
MMGLRPHPEIQSPSVAVDSILEPVGLVDHINKFLHQLSGGQRQRVAIVRALVMCPNIILANEATASLVGKTGRVAVEQLHDFAAKQGATILLVTYCPTYSGHHRPCACLEDSYFVGMTVSEAGQTELL